MTLSEFRRQHRTSTRGSSNVALESGTEEWGTIRSLTAYAHPINALYQGNPVTLIATGDIVGMSPCAQFVDEDGKLDWAPSEEFVVDDRHVIPASSETRRRLQQQAQNTRNTTR